MRISGLLVGFGLCIGLISCQSEQNVAAIPSVQLVPDTVENGHWLTHNTLLLSLHPESASVRIYNTSNAFAFKDTKRMASTLLSPSHHPIAKPKHLNHLTAYHWDINRDTAKQALKGMSLVVQFDALERPLRVSTLQTGWVLDALYTSGGNDADELNDYGATLTDDGVQFRLWAPTAKSVEVLLFDQNKQPLPTARLAMQEDPNTGAWTATGSADLDRVFYQYRLTLWHPQTQEIETVVTTDPYSLSLSTNSLYSQVIDLTDSDTAPQGWQNHTVPDIAAPEDNILYELHIRDFSASDNALSNPAYRGKYKAFSEQQSHGIKHLSMLKNAGLNNIHLLPTFDIGTVNEDPAQVIDLDDNLGKLCNVVPSHFICEANYNAEQSLRSLLESYNTNTADAQAVIEALREHDPYNWGYDPFHYTVPEGSYALNPDGSSRIVEFREMVQNIHAMGFRVIMDVVYNHTYEAGLEPKSVLDKIVPGYYHRKHPNTGEIEQSTCCDNTATERRMMAKLMTDSLVVWARDYKIDGFRFDLMGHQPKDAMLAARAAVQTIDPDTYFYGEGWNFGEVENDAQFEQAAQVQLAGSEIGTFTDRLRDAIRGGAPFAGGDDIRAGQGIGNGLITAPNELAKNDAAEYALSMDQVRIGLAGNLANFPLVDSNGAAVTGKDIDYGGAPTGYALDPADTVNYVSKHDNQSLWDNHQYRIAYNTSTEDRVRMQVLTLAYPLMAQGIPFLHMGQELLRSKSFLRDSYDYGDWFNAVDFSYQSNNYNVGLPPAVKDQDNWALIQTVLANNEGRDHVSKEHIEYAANTFAELIEIRMSSPLFRLRTEQDIVERVSFLNTGLDQQTGLIAMLLDDSNQAIDLDDNYEQILVVFNNDMETIGFDSGIDGLALHPVLVGGVDERLQETMIRNGVLNVPALSAAVFVK